MTQVTPPPIPGTSPPPIPQAKPPRLSSVQLQLLVGIGACALVATLSSGIPVWMALIVLLLLAASLTWKNMFAFYLATFIVGALMLIPWLREGWNGLQLGFVDLVYACAFVGMLGCGLSYFETFTSHYEVWNESARKARTNQAGSQSHSEWVNQSVHQNAFSQWVITGLLGMAIALFVLWAIPVEERSRSYYAMVPSATRICLILLYMFFPTWALSSFLSILAWRFIGPRQARVFVWREFNDEIGRDLRAVEKRIAKLSK